MSKKVDKELVEKYRKKLTVVSRKRRTGLIIAGSVLLAGAAGTGGYFAYKAATRLPDVVVDGYIIKFNDTTLKELKVKKGEILDLGNIKPEKKGYLFSGWFYDKELTQRCPSKITINKDLTIYAKWTLIITEKGLGFVLNTDNNSYTVFCENKQELYDEIKDKEFKLTIPTSHNNKPITTVGYYNSELDYSAGFEECKFINTIDFQTSVVEISPRAFKNCEGLVDISIENTNIKSIGAEAFANCKSLKTFTSYTKKVNSPLIEIGENAFYGNTALTTIYLSKSLLRLSNNAFKNCTSLTEVNFDASSTIQNIGESCFEGCTSLTDCKIPYSICKFNKNSFKECPCDNLTIYDTISSWCKEDGTKIEPKDIPSALNNGDLIYKEAIQSPTYKLSFYLTGYISDAEYNLSAADSSDRETPDVTIPDTFTVDSVKYNVTRVAEQGFKDSNITSVSIPSTVITIGADAFNNCRSLSTVIFAAGTESLKGIGDNAFKSSSITAITLPTTVKSIGTNAFCYTNLSNIEIPASVEELKYSKLQVTDPTTQEKYDATLAPFYGCHYLKSITVANDNTYYKSIDGVLFEKNVEEIGGFTLMRFPELKTNLTNNTYQIPNETTIIASGSFYGNKNAKIINLSNNVLMINDGAFASADRDNVIEEININDSSSLMHIGKYAFDGAKFKTINIANLNSLTTIDDYAFYKCSNLNKIEIPTKVNYLGLNILANCSQIYSPTQVVFKDDTSSWNIYKHNTEETYEKNFIPVESSATKQDALSYLRGSNNRIAYWKKN